MQKICQLILATALCLSVGLHWGVVQSAAWAGMVLRFSQNAPFGEAFEKTFDGLHPCRLCKIVERGKDSGGAQKDPSSHSFASKKLDLFAADKESPFVFPTRLLAHFPPVFVGRSTVFSPPVPPPRIG